MQKRAPVTVQRTNTNNVTNAKKGYDKPWLNNSNKPNQKPDGKKTFLQ